MIPFPNKKYSIIYADPPWYHPGDMVGGTGKGSNASRFYPTMLTKDIYELPVQDICEKDCLLFLWVISPMLQQGLRTGESWDFRYITTGFVWDKQRILPGRYTMSQCELCLIFSKGNLIKSSTEDIRQFLSVKRGEHSTKPIIIKEYLDKMFPEHSKIELFARPLPLERFIPNNSDWDYWGDQV